MASDMATMTVDDPKPSDGGGLAQPLRAKAARVG
jgi:hypothetical protein